MKVINFSPLTKKRFKNFKSLKRSYYSLILLSLFYFISLFSEFIANDKPLIMRFEKKYYFPILKYYSENTFLQNGINTRLDYKKFISSPAFRKNTDNFAFFPVIPYNPNEIEDSRNFEENLKTNIILKQHNMLFGSMRVDNGMNIIEMDDNVRAIFHISDDYENILLSNLFDTGQTTGLENIIKKRFTGEPSEPVRLELKDKTGIPINIKMSSTPGGPVKKTMKINVSESSVEFSSPRIVIDSKSKIISVEQKFREMLEIKNDILNSDFYSVISRVTADTSVLQFISEKLKGEQSAINYISFKTISGEKEFEFTFQKEKPQFPYKPTKKHFLGIDESGRDILSRIVYGMRISISFGLILVASAMFFGFIIGGAQGFSGGIIDITAQRCPLNEIILLNAPYRRRERSTTQRSVLRFRISLPVPRSFRATVRVGKADRCRFRGLLCISGRLQRSLRLPGPIPYGRVIRCTPPKS